MIKESNHTVDLLVIGGGGAGLPAALSALDAGVRRVLLIEKRPNTGGNAGMAGGFLFAAESRHQRDAGQVIERDAVFKELMEYHHYDRVNPHILRAWIDRCGKTIDWVEDRGKTPYMFGDMHLMRSHMPRVHDAPVGTFTRVTRALTECIRQAGGEVITNIRATGLERDIESGTFVVHATEKDGTELRYNARAVVITSGGFTGNIPLLKQNFPHYYDDVYWTDAVPNMGEGIDMARMIGADMEDYCTLVRENGYSFMTKKSLPNRAGMDPRCLWVNSEGRRFCDETVAHDNASTNALLKQPGKVGFALFDNELIDHILSHPNDLMPSDLMPKIDIRAVFDAEARADGAWCRSTQDLTELATWLGANPEVLTATIAEYNAYCAQGRDALFAKEAKYLYPLRSPPYYALKFRPLMIETAGPLKVNEHMEILDPNGQPIPGCFAAGAITSGWVGHDYHLFGYALSYATTSGLIAGESAAAYLRDTKQS